MRLRRLEIRRFRKLAGPVVLDRLGDGITVIGGDNEEGKSTVLAALKAALFEPHGVGGAVREQMTPHDGGVPEVLVELEAGDGPYRLSKAFRKGGISLDTPRGRLSGDAAEQALVDLLRFERRTAREAKPQNLGLQAIFWVDQGTSFGGFESLEASRDRLSAAVEAEAGVLAAGDRGRRLLQNVTRAVREHWTPGWKETGALAEAGRRVQALTAAYDDLLGRRQVHDAGIDRLARLRDERRRTIEADELGRAREAAVVARQAVAGIEAMEVELDRLRSEVQLRHARWQRLDEQIERRHDLARRAEDCRAAADRAAEDLVVRRDGSERADALAKRTATAEVEQANALAGIERQHERIAGRQRIAELARQLAKLRADLAAATEAGEAVARLGAALAADRATAEQVAAAAEAQAARRVAEAALRAVATRLEFAPHGQARIRAAGRWHGRDRPLLVTEPTEIELDGFGSLTVRPGGDDVEPRRAALAKAERALSDALAGIGVSTVAEAQARLEARQETERELVAARARLKAILGGYGAAQAAVLAEQVAGAEAELAVLRTRWPVPEDGPEDGEGLDGATLETQRRRALAARDEAADERQRAEARAAELRVELARYETRSAELGERHQAAQLALAQEAERIGDTQLLLEHQAAEAGKAEAGLRLAATERQVAARDPALARDRLAQAERRVAAIEAELARLDRDIRDVEVELRSGEVQAFGERLAEVEGELARAEAERRRLLGIAEAWKLLHEELTAAVASARDALLVPIRQRIAPYLRRLFPDAEVVLDPATLALDRLRRGKADERFGQLSHGTREQLAIIVRLALAQLLQEKEGQSPCLVLDDALVYADEARLDVMKTILQQAGRDLQILILTCRPRDYRGLEARFLRLEDCRG